MKEPIHITIEEPMPLFAIGFIAGVLATSAMGALLIVTLNLTH